MSAPIFTASEIDKLMSCPGAASMAKVYENVKASRVGRELHHKYLRPGMLPQSMRLWLCGGDPRNAPKQAQNQFEASFEYHPVTGDARCLGINLNRFYEVTSPHYSSGTTDVYNYWWLDGLLHLRVSDLKTGYAQNRGALPDPINSWQLKWYALAIASALTMGNLDQIGSCVISFMILDESEQFTIKPNGEVNLTIEDLKQARESVRWLYEQITNNPGGNWSIGPWCANCQQFLSCPIQIVQFEKMGMLLEHKALITAESVRTAWYHAQAAEKLAKKMKALIGTFVEQSEGKTLPTKPGWELRRTEGTRRTPIPDKALAVVQDIMPELAESLTSRGVTLGRLRFIMGEDTERLLDILEEHGAVKVTETSSIRECRTNAPKGAESEDD